MARCPDFQIESEDLCAYGVSALPITSLTSIFFVRKFQGKKGK